MEIPRAQPLPTGVTDASLGKGLATGLQAGNQMAYIASQTRAQELTNQYMPQTIALKQQEMQMLMAKQKVETDKAKADAINGIGQIAPLLKTLPPAKAKALLASHIAKISNIFGDNSIDASLVNDQNVDEIEQWAKGRPEIEAKGSPDALTTYDSMWWSQMSETQREIIKDIKPVTPQEMFSQAEIKKRTVFSQGQESQRASAGATAPLVGKAFDIKLIQSALDTSDSDPKAAEFNDHLAMNKFYTLLGAKDQEDFKALAKAGTWGPSFARNVDKFFGEGALAKEQRDMIRGALRTFSSTIGGEVGTRTAQYPGATAPVLPPPPKPKTKIIDGTTFYQQGNNWILPSPSVKQTP